MNRSRVRTVRVTNLRWTLTLTSDIIEEKNLALQDDLYRLRSETQTAYDEARSLQARWKELDREQKELYQVCQCRPTYNALTP